MTVRRLAAALLFLLPALGAMTTSSLVSSAAEAGHPVLLGIGLGLAGALVGAVLLHGPGRSGAAASAGGRVDRMAAVVAGIIAVIGLACVLTSALLPTQSVEFVMVQAWVLLTVAFLLVVLGAGLLLALAVRPIARRIAGA